MFSDPKEIRTSSWMCLFPCVPCLCSCLLPPVFHLFLPLLSEHIMQVYRSSLSSTMLFKSLKESFACQVALKYSKVGIHSLSSVSSSPLMVSKVLVYLSRMPSYISYSNYTKDLG